MESSNLKLNKNRLWNVTYLNKRRSSLIKWVNYKSMWRYLMCNHSSQNYVSLVAFVSMVFVNGTWFACLGCFEFRLNFALFLYFILVFYIFAIVVFHMFDEIPLRINVWSLDSIFHTLIYIVINLNDLFILIPWLWIYFSRTKSARYQHAWWIHSKEIKLFCQIDKQISLCCVLQSMFKVVWVYITQAQK